MDQKSMWRQASAEMCTVHCGQDTARRCGGWRSPPYPAEQTHMKNAVYILGTHCRLHQKIGVEQCSLWGLLLISTHHEDSEHWSRRNKMKVEVKKEKKKRKKRPLFAFWVYRSPAGCSYKETQTFSVSALSIGISHHFSRAMEILRAKSAAVARKEASYDGQSDNSWSQFKAKPAKY